jgi:hypothetical protein
MTKPKPTTIPDPESLSEAERKEILKQAGARVRRQLENETIARELERQVQEGERRESS